MNAITVTTSGLQCDNPKCDFVDPTIKFEDYSSWVNKPCPKCGENLLTETDYNDTVKAMNLVDFLNKILPSREPNEKLESIKFKIHDGIKIIPNENI